jgi:hypothetical protein
MIWGVVEIMVGLLYMYLCIGIDICKYTAFLSCIKIASIDIFLRVNR